MTSTAVAPTNAAQAAYSSAGKSSTSSASSSSSSSSTSSVSSSQLSANNSLASLADNFQNFLSLLTTQLKNQDPTSPLDTNQFTQQITSMTGVEQQLLSTNLLQTLVAQQTGVGAAAGLIGDNVTATNPDGTDTPISGTVSAVTMVKGQTELTVGSTQVPISALTSVTSNASNLSALIGG
jgi:flagellar basal-body rod modification protein FlgD